MKVLVVGDGGIGEVAAALIASLRRSGVTVAVAERVTEAVEVLDLTATIMREVDRIAARPLAPLPQLVPNLPKRSSWPVPGIGRTGKRQREQRTKRSR